MASAGIVCCANWEDGNNESYGFTDGALRGEAGGERGAGKQETSDASLGDRDVNTWKM